MLDLDDNGSRASGPVRPRFGPQPCLPFFPGVRMRLAWFIKNHMGAILLEWDAFASTLLPTARQMSATVLRDHAQAILDAIATDLSTAQSSKDQHRKSWGRGPEPRFETAAQTHAILRAHSGFDINQLAAEYRALRASVLRLWTEECSTGPLHQDDMIRFNEAIDQALAESMQLFTSQVEQARNLLLGMLGHDMRSPLQTIQMTSSYLAAMNAGEAVSGAASRLIRSGARMQALLDDMLDFNRTKLGLGIEVKPEEVDLRDAITDELDQIRAAHPGREVRLETSGDSRGTWDGQRLQQLLGNLVVNALKYGSQESPVHVRLSGDEPVVLLEVSNRGPAIEPCMLERIFDPLRRGHSETADRGSLGLGLYIAREIAKAHGGEITARSDENATVFSVRLPRRPAVV